MLDSLNTVGVNFITSIHEQYPDSEHFFNSVTEWFEPVYAYTIFFPLLVGLNTKLAIDIVVVSAVSEWLNTILKWLLREDRPYWWVQETSVYGTIGPDSQLTSKRPYLKQTRLTCETGPGSPSGHLMGAAVLAYILVQAANKLIRSRQTIGSGSKTVLSGATWLMFALLMALVAVSRLYVSTHFPHQCLLGALLGVGVSWALTSPDCALSARWRSGSRPALLLAALAATLFTVACYWLQKACGIDPQWSVKLAFKWCENPEHIHVATTPMFCLVRDCGIFFGIALAAPLNKIRSQMPVVPAVITSVCFGWAFDLAATAIPTGDVRVFYACQFMLQAVQPFIYLVCIPRIGRIMKIKHE